MLARRMTTEMLDTRTCSVWRLLGDSCRIFPCSSWPSSRSPWLAGAGRLARIILAHSTVGHRDSSRSRAGYWRKLVAQLREQLALQVRGKLNAADLALVAWRGDLRQGRKWLRRAQLRNSANCAQRFSRNSNLSWPTERLNPTGRGEHPWTSRHRGLVVRGFPLCGSAIRRSHMRLGDSRCSISRSRRLCTSGCMAVAMQDGSTFWFVQQRLR